MRQISFALTTPQFKARTKYETRRGGWLWLVKHFAHSKEPVPLMGVEKGQGIPKGGHVVKLGKIFAIAAERCELNSITQVQTVNEGFPEYAPGDFVQMYCAHNGGDECQPVTRIQFRYVCECGAMLPRNATRCDFDTES